MKNIMNPFFRSLLARKAHRSSVAVQGARVILSLSLTILFTFSLWLAAPVQQAKAVYQVAGATCATNRPTKLMFLLDRSGSMAQRGQTYNSQIDGVIRSLRDPSVVPRDGSIEVGIVVFAENAVALLVNGKPLTQINSFSDAEMIAAQVATLKCANLESQIAPCPFGATSMESAVQLADSIVSQNGNKQAHRLLVMSTDGQTADDDAAAAACRVIEARNAARLLGLTFEFDVLLMGLDPATTEFADNKARVDSIVTVQDGTQTGCSGGGTKKGGGASGATSDGEQRIVPQEAATLPGATLVINGGECAISGLSSDCDRQVNDFAGDIRAILRSSIKAIALVVNTESDSAPGAPVSGQTLSLRQAIEAANCNGGDATITFAASLAGKTISPLVPLPALRQPNIKIDGCSGDNCAPTVTLDGTVTDVTAGESHSDGLLIRANRDVVRGLRIIKFKRAGVAIDPLSPSDVTLNNLIEKNVLENNAAAGVVVRDPLAETANAIQHSTGNTISRNNISDSPVLIDLGGDGKTANDANDADQGANTLLNFPDSISIAAAANNTVNISGQLNGATVAGATVELFGAPKFHIVDGALVLDAIAFLGQTTADANGAFVANGLAVAPSGIYTATVTDKAGNTSEVMFESATVKPGRAIGAATTPINFGDVTLNAASTPRPVQITNTGNAPLVITGCTLVRCAAADADNTARFTITGCPTAPINPGEAATINVTLTPNACGAVKACLALATNDPARPTIPSELNGNGNAVGQGRLTLEGGGSALDFGTVAAKGKGLKAKKRPARTFTIENQGCQSLSLTIPNVVRTGASVNSGKITNTNDSAFFNVVAVNASGVETAITNPVVLAPRQSTTFRIRFNPKIPAVSDKTSGLAASEVLPDAVTSQLVITQAGGNPLTVNLVGRVTTGVRFINAVNPADAPLLNFTRSGDEFTVEFSLYDANLNVSKATYEFIDRNGKVVGTPIDIDMTQQVQARGLVIGQSFRVTQKFTGAKDNSSIAQVRVTVTDNETSDTLAGDVVVLSAIKAQSLRYQSGALLMPKINLADFLNPRNRQKEINKNEK
ncbi:MAG: choice-of-anchor D domain-containing protein [Acidobacteria bacterium]|nr:choice-of-anchor D domain-containing protein [Acidobacteriota bacterium]